MRRASVAALLVVALALSACGDPAEPRPTGTADAPAADDLPLEAVLDDEAVVREVFRAALSGEPVRLATVELTPRVSRVRVAVAALHDTLHERRRSSPERDALLDTLAALADVEGGADAEALGTLVAAWRVWTPEQWDAEKEGQRRAWVAEEALRLPEAPGASGLRELLANAPEPPPMSPSGAALRFVRYAALVLDPAPDGTGETTKAALADARAAFDELGWPGGLALWAERLSAHLLRADPNGRQAEMLWSVAANSYRMSGDLVGSARMYLDRAVTVSAAGEHPRALQFARIGRERMLESGVRGRELFDAHKLHGTMLQRLGRHAEAAEAFRAAFDEAEWARIDARVRLPAASVQAVSLYALGDLEGALAAARGAGTAYDALQGDPDLDLEAIRAGLDETAGEAALALGRADAAVDHFTAALARRDALAERSGIAAHGDARAVGALLVARALYAAGRAVEARKEVRQTLGSGQPPAVVLLAVDVLLGGAKTAPAAAEDAEATLRQLEQQLGAKRAAALGSFRARVEAARGRHGRARVEFAAAVEDAKGGSEDALGWSVAEILLHWAEMEEDIGEWRRAAVAYADAAYHLSQAGMPIRADRARRGMVRVRRRQHLFHSARAWARRRLESPVASSGASRGEAQLDLFLILVELALQRQVPVPDPRKPESSVGFAERADDLIGQMADPESQRVCRLAKSAVLGGLAPSSPGPRPAGVLGRLHDVTGLVGSVEPDMLFPAALEVGRGAGGEQVPEEIRRFAGHIALRRAIEGDDTGHVLRLIELRRHAADSSLSALQSALAPGEAFVAVEPCGEFTAVVVVTRDAASHRRVTGDGGIPEFWDAVEVEPSEDHLAEASAGVASTVLGGIDWPAAGAPPLRLTISVAPPFGMLPWDLLPTFLDDAGALGRNRLVDAAAVMLVRDAAERVRAGRRSVPDAPPPLADRDDPSPFRHAFVELAPLRPEERARVVELFADARKRGRAPAEALREAKLIYEAEWTLPEGSLPRIPAWAALGLRGAP